MGKKKDKLSICILKQSLTFYTNKYQRTSLLEYEPTVACRIIECQFAGTSIELWDTSGNLEYRSGWPAIKDTAQGIIMVYDANLKISSQEDELLMWRDEFSNQVSENQLLILAHSKSGDPTETPKCFQESIVHHTSFSRPNELLSQVETFIHSIHQASK